MQLDSHQEEETKTGLNNEAAEVVRNPEGEIINAKEQIKNKICVKSGNPQWPAKDKIYNRCPKRGHYAKPCKSSEDNAIQEDQGPEQTIQDTDMATNVGYLQAGAVIPRCKNYSPRWHNNNYCSLPRSTSRSKDGGRPERTPKQSQSRQHQTGLHFQYRILHVVCYSNFWSKTLNEFTWGIMTRQTEWSASSGTRYHHLERF